MNQEGGRTLLAVHVAALATASLCDLPTRTGNTHSPHTQVVAEKPRFGDSVCYPLPPQGVNATPLAGVVVSRWEVCGVEEVHGGGDMR